MSNNKAKSRIPRPVLIEAWKAQLEITKRNKKSGEKTLDAAWIQENGMFIDPKTNSFPDNCALKEAPFSLKDLIVLTAMTWPLYTFFLWIPVAIVLCFMYYPPIQATLILLASWFLIYSLPSERSDILQFHDSKTTFIIKLTIISLYMLL